MAQGFTNYSFHTYSPGSRELELEWEEEGGNMATTLGHSALMSKNKQTFPTKQDESVDTAGSHVGSTVERGSLEKAFRRAPSSA